MMKFLKIALVTCVVLLRVGILGASPDTLKVYAKRLIKNVSLNTVSLRENYANLQESNRIAYQISDDSLIGASLNTFTYLLRLQGNPIEAIDSALKSEKYFLKIADSCGLADTYNGIGLCYYTEGNINQAIGYFNRAIAIGRSINHVKLTAEGLLNSGLVYQNTSNFEEAEKCLFSAIEIFTKLNDQISIGRCEENLGLVYLYREEHQKSLDYFFRALAKYKESEGLNLIPSIYDNIGFAYENLKNYDKAVEYYRLCIDKAKEVESTFFYVYGTVDLGRVSLRMNDYAGAIINLVKGKDLAIKYNYGDIVGESYNALSEYYLKIGRPYKSREMLLEYIDYYKGSFNSSTSQQLKSMQAHLDMVLKDFEAEKLQSSLNIERLKRQQAVRVQFAYSVAIVMLIILLVVTILTLIKNRNRSAREREISQQLKELNEELESMVESRTNELSLALDKVQDLERIKNAFLSNVSHEVRTPLNGILGFTRFLVSGDLTQEEKNEYGHYIENLGDRLMRILDDVLELSKIETNQLEVIVDDCNVNSIIDSLYSSYSQVEALKEKNLEFVSTKALSDVNAFFKLDNIKLKRILENLIENAIKFTDKGSIKFGYEVDESHALKFFVKDTGIGIPKNVQQKIFDRFYRHVDNEKSVLYDGAGVGLSIARGFALAMGGRIELESEPGVGSTFYLLLPLVQIATDEHEGFLEGKSILVVEDNIINYHSIESFFASKKVRLIHAKNAEDAFDICDLSVNIDAILLDLQLPFMNGYEAAKILKQNHPNIPIIANSAYSEGDEILLSIKMGCDAFIRKPIDPNELFKILRGVLQ